MPTNRQPSWQAIATGLAQRLAHHAALAGAARETHGMGEPVGCFHTVQDADPEHCPFCADRAAYLMYLGKVRSYAMPEKNGDG